MKIRLTFHVTDDEIEALAEPGARRATKRAVEEWVKTVYRDAMDEVLLTEVKE